MAARAAAFSDVPPPDSAEWVDLRQYTRANFMKGIGIPHVSRFIEIEGLVIERLLSHTEELNIDYSTRASATDHLEPFYTHFKATVSEFRDSPAPEGWKRQIHQSMCASLARKMKQNPSKYTYGSPRKQYRSPNGKSLPARRQNPFHFRSAEVEIRLRNNEELMTVKLRDYLRDEDIPRSIDKDIKLCDRSIPLDFAKFKRDIGLESSEDLNYVYRAFDVQFHTITVDSERSFRTALLALKPRMAGEIITGLFIVSFIRSNSIAQLLIDRI